MREPRVARSNAIAIAKRLGRALAPPSAKYEPFVVDDRVTGWITPERAQRLARLPAFRKREGALELSSELRTRQARSEALAEVTRTLASEGALTAWRDELFPVGGTDGEPLFEIERAAARYFGIRTHAAHANGLVGDPSRWRMWLARRSPDKAIDPGLLDNLVGGGIATGSDVMTTLVKEAWEEAGIGPEVARRAQPVGAVDICRDQADGLQRETIYVHDLWLSEDFAPANRDGEAVEHRLCEPAAIFAVLATDDITADASLVIVDFLLRSGQIASRDAAAPALDALRHPECNPSRDLLKPL